MKTILYNPIFINPQAYYVFPRLTRYLQPDNESTAEPANYIGTIEVKVIAYGDTTLKRTYTNTDSIDLSEFKNTWIRISLFTKVGSCVLGEWKIGNMESDLPYIDPEVLASLKAVVIVGNKTNNDSDRAIVKNLVDASNPFVISNASYNLNSGYGKYNITFQHFPYRENIISINDNKVVFDKGGQLLLPYPSMDRDIPSFKVKVSGLSGTYHFRYYYRDSNGAQDSINMAKDGIYELPICYNVQSSSDGTNCGFANNGSDIVTIEQVPEFQGAFVTDGVNDVITSTKTALEMLGETNEITVVSMIHQITLNGRYNIGLTNYIRSGVTGNSGPYLRSLVTDSGKTGIYGYTAYNLNKNIDKNSAVINNILGDKNDYYLDTNNDYILDDSLFSVQNFVHRDGSISDESSSVAWYWTIIANKVLTTDQINQVIAYFNLDRTLKPDILCDVKKQGITNENHAEFGDKLIDFSGNGRDIQLNNLAWKGGSGIAAKQYETFKDWTNTPYQTSTVTEIDEFTRVVDSTSNAYWVSMINRTSDFDKVHDSINIVLYQDDMLLVHECKYKIDENVTTKALYETLKSGVNTITLATIDKFTDIPEDAEIMSLGEWVNPKSNKGSVKITLLPSYEGGVLLDGINDFGKVTGMPIYKDYIFIADRQIITNDDSGGIVASKSESSTDVAKQGAFIFEYLSTNAISTWSYYKNNSLVANSDSNRNISYQSKYSYNGKALEIGEGKDSDKLWIGTIRDNDERFANIAIYSLMSFPYSMSEFLIERQLKKHKLGTLYPDMVEFRPIIKSNIDTLKINYWDKDWNVVNVGDYVSVGNDIKTNITVPNGYKVSKVTSDAFDNITIGKSSTDFIYDVKFYGIKKSPQKITMTIEQDENYVKFEPVITSNVEYVRLDFYLNNYQKRINIGDYIPKDAYLRANFYLKNNVDELTVFTFNGVNIGYRRSSVDDTAFNINQIYNYDSPQEVNITIDEYIRYEDIVQPYPVLLRFNDENGNEVSWGGKLRVGSTITRIGSAADSNLLPNIYNIFGLLLNDNQVTSSKVIVEKTMVFKAKSAYIFDNNEPNCILSPRLLRIPNSSYKILGYIPDISGHGNHGILHNSAYIEGSGVNEDGSYQFDGVDDFVTIPTVTGGGKQVLMKVNNNTINSMLYDQRSSGASPNSLNSDFAIYNTNTVDNNLIAYQSRLVGKTYIDGILNTNITCEDLLGVLHNITITCDIVVPNNGVVPNIGRGGVLKDLYSKVALYDFMLFDEISTDDKIKELNEYVGIEAKVELPPYYWDAYGKTNLDADKATIQQRGVAIGDYDLINNNFAYEGMSGYNGYPAVFGTNKTYANLVPNDGNFILTSSHNIINVTKFDTSYGLLYSHIKLDGKLTSRNIDYPSYKIKVTGLGENFGLHYSYLESSSDTTVKGFEINNDGIYIIPKSFASDGSLTSNSDWIGFIFTGTAPESCNVTIEVLPEYENGLVYDGVTDYSENANIPAFTDYTYIFKRTLLNKKYNSASVFKGSNQQSGGGAFICDYNSVEPELMIQGYSFGAGLYANSLNTNDIVYGTKNSVNGAIIAPGNNADVEGLAVGKWRAYRQMVFYKLILYPKTISLLQINFLKNLMERDEIIDLTNPIFIQE